MLCLLDGLNWTPLLPMLPFLTVYLSALFTGRFKLDSTAANATVPKGLWQVGREVAKKVIFLMAVPLRPQSFPLELCGSRNFGRRRRKKVKIKVFFSLNFTAFFCCFPQKKIELKINYPFVDHCQIR